MQKSILKEKEYKKPARTADNDVLKKNKKDEQKFTTSSRKNAAEAF